MRYATRLTLTGLPKKECGSLELIAKELIVDLRELLFCPVIIRMQLEF